MKPKQTIVNADGDEGVDKRAKYGMQIEVRPFAGWRNNAWLRRDGIELVVTLDVGPRIVHYARNREESPLAVLDDQLGGVLEDAFVLRGGHRLWIAPESDGRSYVPDNTPVRRQLLPDGVVATGSVEPSGLQKRLTVRLGEGAIVHVRHEIENAGAAATICARVGD